MKSLKYTPLLILLLASLNSSPLLAGDNLLQQAQQAADSGDLKSSIIHLKNMLQKDPENAAARFLLGDDYLRVGDAASAEKELQRAKNLGYSDKQLDDKLIDSMLMQKKIREVQQYIKDNPARDNAQAASYKAVDGVIAFSNKQIEQAKKLFDEALALDQNNLRASLGLISYQVQKNENDAALQLLNGILEKDPSQDKALQTRADLYRKLGRNAEAVADYEKILAKTPANPNALFGMAFVKAASKQPEQMQTYLNKLSKPFQSTPVAQYLYGLSHFMQKQPDKAESYLSNVLKVVPEHLQSHLLLGVIKYSAGNWRQAEDHFLHVISQFQNVGIAKLLGATYVKLKEPDKAISLLEKYASLAPKDGQILSLLGSAYMLKGDSTNAQQWFSRAVEVSPDQAGVRTQLALGQLGEGDVDAAISTLESAVDLGQDMIQTDVLLVMSHLKRGDLEKALSISQQLHSKYPDSAIPQNLTGLAYMAGKQFDKADQAFEKSLAIDPQFLTAQINMARNSIAAGKMQQATERFQQVVQKDPGNITALLGLSQLAAKQGNPEQQIVYLQQLLDNHPQELQATVTLAEIYLSQGEKEKALSTLSALTGKQAEHPVVIRLRGLTQLAQANYTDAIHSFRRLAEILPDNIEAQYQLGRAYLLGDKNDLARNAFDKAGRQDSDYQVPLLWLTFAELELREQHFDRALEIAGELVKKHPDNPLIYELTAAANKGKGDIDKAIAAYAKANQLQASSKRVQMLASLYSENRQIDKSIQTLSSWLKENPQDSGMSATLGLLYQQQGNNKAAIDAYKQSLKYKGDNPVVLNNLAWLYHEEKDPQALAIAKQAYEKAPKKPEIVDTYGWILLEQGNAKQALPILQEALLQSPTHPEIAFHVAQALTKLNRDSEAKTILQRIIRNTPSSPFATKAKQMLGQ